jgi:hypothetical protein
LAAQALLAPAASGACLAITNYLAVSPQESFGQASTLENLKEISVDAYHSL